MSNRFQETLEAIANGEWVTDSSAQELARQTLATPAPEPQGVRLTAEQVMKAINYWRGYNGTLEGATNMLNRVLAASPATVAGTQNRKETDMENREQKASRLVKESGKETHSSDCATSIAPAEEPGPCDCFATVAGAAPEELNEKLQALAERAVDRMKSSPNHWTAEYVVAAIKDGHAILNATLLTGLRGLRDEWRKAPSHQDTMPLSKEAQAIVHARYLCAATLDTLVRTAEGK